MEREGRWLFRHRSALPLVAVAALVGGIIVEPPLVGAVSGWEIALWLGVGLAGCLGRVLVAGYVPKRTSGRNTTKGQVADQLNTTGLYSVVRHPLYLANYLVTMGFLGALGSIWALVVATLIFWIYYERIMLAEEAFLRQSFGAGFERWAAVTPPFIPRLTGFRRASLPFCGRTAIKREYTSIATFAVAFTVALQARIFYVRREIALEHIDLVLAGAAGAALALYIGFRVLRKRRLFSVKGR